MHVPQTGRSWQVSGVDCNLGCGSCKDLEVAGLKEAVEKERNG